jgi:hypothetical protein
MGDTETGPQARTGNLIGDITDDEIQEWKNSRNGGRAMRFAASTAEDIRQGEYAPGQEIYGAEVRKWIVDINPEGMPAATFEKAMNLLVEKKMVRVVIKKEGRKVEKFYYVAGDETA